jgi:hypothetical protein
MAKYILTIEKTENGFSVDEQVEGGISLFEIIGMLNHLQLQKGLQLIQEVNKEMEDRG